MYNDIKVFFYQLFQQHKSDYIICGIPLTIGEFNGWDWIDGLSLNDDGTLSFAVSKKDSTTTDFVPFDDVPKHLIETFQRFVKRGDEVLFFPSKLQLELNSAMRNLAKS